MRNKRITVFAAVMMLLLTGCGNSENIIGGEVQNIEKNTEKQAEEPAAADMQEEQAEYKGDKGYVFLFNGVSVEMDAEAAPVVEALGEPVSYFEAASCAFEGIDRIYTYSSFELNTYPVDDVDFISAVIIKDDSVTTAEGIAIGDSKEEMLQIYGMNYAEEQGMVIYEKDGTKLKFILSDDKIISIEYTSGVI